MFFLHALLLASSFAEPASAQEPEVRRAIPVSSPGTSGLQERGQPEEIRLAPLSSNDPQKIKEAQYAVADGFYRRKEYAIAIAEYQKFLQLSAPGDARRDQALFNMGESFRSLDKGFEAQATYQQLLKEIPSGDLAASASYRLGEYYHLRKELQNAVDAFFQAVQLSANPQIKNAARYQEGLCRDELGEQDKAALLFDEISKTTEDNATRYNALMLLAAHDEKAGHPEKAIVSYLIVGNASSTTMTAEALVKAAMISTRLGDKNQATQLFTKATALKEGGAWSSIAALGIMKLAYEAKDYKKVVAQSPQALGTSDRILSKFASADEGQGVDGAQELSVHKALEGVSTSATKPFAAEVEFRNKSNLEQRSQALLLTAQAERQLGNLGRSLALYDQLLQEFPASDAAHDASFSRLLLLQSLKDSSLLSQIDTFLLAASDKHQKSQAELLKAETLFQKGDYAAAAKAYAIIPSSDLAPELKANALYKEAWSLQHAGDMPSAIASYTTFLNTYPNSPQLPDAMMQRAFLEQKTDALTAAITDYTSFLDKYPNAPERELALQQKALTQGQQQDNAGMVATFQQLLTAYPKSTAAAQANYWSGWAAFEAKNYAKAIPFLEKSIQLNPKQFGEKAGVRLLLCHYYLEQPSEAARDAAALKQNAIPGEVSRWLGLKAYERGDLAQAEHFLLPLVTSGNTNLVKLDVVMALAQTLVKEGKFHEAEVPATKALELSYDPTTRAAAMLTLAKVQQGLKNDSKADTLVHEALLLQPEGSLNMEARILSGDLLMNQKNYDAAARAYMAVALLSEDPAITPRALSKASEAYQRANNIEESQKALQELKRRFPTAK